MLTATTVVSRALRAALDWRPTALAKLRMESMLLGACSVRLPVLLERQSRDWSADLSAVLERVRRRATLSGTSDEAALKSEFVDRALGQWTFFVLMMAMLCAALTLALSGAPEWLAATVAFVPSLLWGGLLVAESKLRTR